MLYKHIGLVEGIGEFVMIWNMNSFPEEAVSPERENQVMIEDTVTVILASIIGLKFIIPSHVKSLSFLILTLKQKKTIIQYS